MDDDMILVHSADIYHWGILGQRWGQRRFQNEDGTYTEEGKARRRSYSSTGIRAAIARRKNEKVDKGFKKWQEGSKNKADAIEKGKNYVQKRINYETDKSNLEAKEAYKTSKKEYKQALKKNTTYRKGSVKDEVYHDLARKYLSAAKRTEKALQKDPNNKDLQKQYNKYMSQHDIYRAKGRKAQDKAAKISNKKANVKRRITVLAKTAATAAVITAGVAAANKIVENKKFKSQMANAFKNWNIKVDRTVFTNNSYDPLHYAKSSIKKNMFDNLF